VKITVLLDTFPSMSETFIYTTMANWQKAGLDVRLLARKRGQSLHQMPFQSDITWLPSEGWPAPFKLLVTLFFSGTAVFLASEIKNCFQHLAPRPRVALKIATRRSLFPALSLPGRFDLFPFWRAGCEIS